MDIKDVYRIFHPMDREYTFVSAARGSFFKVNHNINLNNYKTLKIFFNLFTPEWNKTRNQSKRNNRNKQKIYGD